MTYEMSSVNLSARVAMILILMRRRRRRQRRRERKVWARAWLERRYNKGFFGALVQELREEDPESYRQYCRVTPEGFDTILKRVGPLIKKVDTNMRKSIQPDQRLAVTLRFLATGESFKSLSYSFRIGERTISNIVVETCDVLYDCLKEDYLQVPSTEENWLKIAKEFQLKWNYPLCLGALDGKHVSLRQPPNSGSEFYNYKQFFSVVMLALVDANYRFLYVDVGATGRCGDAGIFNNSSLKTALDCNTLNFPGPVQHEFKMLNYHIIGDEAFALRKDLMKPFPHRSTSKEEKIFNYRLSRARRVVENAFGILSNRFRVFLTTICLPEDKVKKIILAACCLHNFLLDSQTVPPGLVDQEDDHHNIIPGSWRSDSLCLSDISATKANNVCLGAKEQRESLKAYFNSVAGQVHWQDKMISVNSTY